MVYHLRSFGVVLALLGFGCASEREFGRAEERKQELGSLNLDKQTWVKDSPTLSNTGMYWSDRAPADWRTATRP
jgi:hypothetical protein